MRNKAIIICAVIAVFLGVVWGSSADAAGKPIAPASVDPGGGGRPACNDSTAGMWYLVYNHPYVFAYQCRPWWPYYGWVFVYWYQV